MEFGNEQVTTCGFRLQTCLDFLLCQSTFLHCSCFRISCTAAARFFMAGIKELRHRVKLFMAQKIILIAFRMVYIMLSLLNQAKMMDSVRRIQKSYEIEC
ncbi:MAG: hypothetical protein HZB37_06190 [Planctomycetes bacterium]|nr:hypothetical protein [Planctomycetota bacterium]